MKVVLIDYEIDYKTFIGCLKLDVYPVFIENTDTFQELFDKIKAFAFPISHVLIAQHSRGEGLYIGSEPLISYSDSSTWDSLKKFLIDLKGLGIQTVDFLACLLYAQPGVPEMFAALEAETGIDLRASTDYTGNIEVGGNWIMESDMIDIQDIYFTQKIENFKQLFIEVKIGTGGGTYNTATTYPTPYGKYSGGAKSQFFITAAELSNTGMRTNANITQVKFKVLSNASNVGTLSNFTIGFCHTTSANPLSNSAGVASSNFTTLYTSNYTVVKSSTSSIYASCNAHTLTSPFIWNGSNGIVIQFCHTNTSSIFYNASVEWTSNLSMAAVWSRWVASTTTNCATSNLTLGSFTTRPNIYFEYTPGVQGVSITNLADGTNLGEVVLTIQNPALQPMSLSINGGSLISLPTLATTSYTAMSRQGSNTYVLYGKNTNNVDVSDTKIFTPRNPTISGTNGNLGIVNFSITNYNATYTLYDNSGIVQNNLTSTSLSISLSNLSSKSYYIIATTQSNPSIAYTSGTIVVTPNVPTFNVGFSIDKILLSSITIYNGTNLIFEKSSDNITFTTITVDPSGVNYIDNNTMRREGTYYYRIKASSSSGTQFTSASKSLLVNSHIITSFRYIDTTNNDGIRYIKIDSNNNRYIVLYTTTWSIEKYNSSDVLQWSTSITSSGTSLEILGMDVDSTGNVYACGSVIGTSGTTLTYNNGTSYKQNNSQGGFVIKYNSSGLGQWVNWIDGSQGEKLYAIAVDSSNFVYVVGHYTATGETLSLNNGISATPQSSGGQRAFIAKYNSSGLAQWLQFIENPGKSSIPYYVTCTNDNVYVCGYLSGTSGASLTIGISPNTITVTMPSSTLSAFLVKYNLSGVPQWMQFVDGTDADQAFSIATDKNENIYLVGYTASTFVSANNGKTGTRNSSDQGAFLVKYNSAGLAQFITFIDGNLLDNPTRVKIDAAGNIYISGYVEGTSSTLITLNNGVSATKPSGTTSNFGGFLAKYNADGLAKWIYFIDRPSEDIAMGLDIDSSNNIYVVGYITDTAGSIYTFSNGLTVTKPSDGTGGFIAKYSNIVNEVILPLTGSITPTLATISNTQSTTLSVIASGGISPYSYLWKKGTVALVGEISNNLVVTNNYESADVSSTSIYTCTITDINQTSLDLSASITFSPYISLIATAVNPNPIVPLNGSTTLSLDVSNGKPSYTYSWTLSGDSTVLSTEATCNLLNNYLTADVSLNQTYICTVKDSLNIKTVNVQFNATFSPYISLYVEMSSTFGNTLNAGEETTITASGIGGYPPYTYTWYSVGPPDIPLYNTDAITISGNTLRVKNIGQYSSGITTINFKCIVHNS